MKKYYDKNNKEIKAGMYLTDGESIEKVYYNSTKTDLGFNTLNKDIFKECLPFIDSLSEFRLNEWKIHKLRSFKELQKLFNEYTCPSGIYWGKLHKRNKKYVLVKSKYVHYEFGTLEEVEKLYNDITAPMPF